MKFVLCLGLGLLMAGYGYVMERHSKALKAHAQVLVAISGYVESLQKKGVLPKPEQKKE